MKGEYEGVRPREDGETYVEYYLDHHNLEKSTEGNYRSAWNRLERWCDNNRYSIDEMDRTSVEKLCEDWEKDDDLANETAQSYIRHISKLVDWLVAETDEANYNPYRPFRSYFPTERKDTEKLEITDGELRSALQNAKQLRIELFIYLTLLLKTGMRAAEALNLDLRDINLDHPISEKMPQCRTEIRNYPDTIYIDSSVREGKEYNGEVRQQANKEDSTRKIPIDDELKNILVWWIAMLPPTTSSAEPLLRKVTDTESRRISYSQIQEFVTEWARSNNMNSQEMKHFGVDSHWCRHWFSTKMRTNISPNEIPIGTPKEYVKGLRGDTDTDTIATYTQEWKQVEESSNKSYREVYEDNVPKLFSEQNE